MERAHLPLENCIAVVKIEIKTLIKLLDGNMNFFNLPHSEMFPYLLILKSSLQTHMKNTSISRNERLFSYYREKERLKERDVIWGKISDLAKSNPEVKEINYLFLN